MKIDRQETLRYMRCGGVAPDAALAARIDAVEREVLRAARPVAYWRLERVESLDGGRYAIGGIPLESRALGRVIQGCPHAFLFLATLGTEVDGLIRRLAKLSAVDQLIAQAAAAALVESYCDDCEARMSAEVAPRGERLRKRYSPGYGDLPLAVQKSLLAALDSSRRVGVTLLDTLLMVPSKSVSAIIGAGPAREGEGEKV